MIALSKNKVSSHEWDELGLTNSLSLIYDYSSLPYYPDLIDYPSPATHCYYFQNVWSTTDSWLGISGSPTVANGMISTTAAVQGIYKTGLSDIQGKIVSIAIRSSTSSPTAMIQYYSSATWTTIISPTLTINQWSYLSVTLPTGTAITGLRFGNGSFQFDIDWIYIGDGSYSSTLPDLSNNDSNTSLTPFAVTKQVSNMGTYLQFNGSTSYMSESYTFGNSFSISTWFNKTANNSYNMPAIFHKSTGDLTSLSTSVGFMICWGSIAGTSDNSLIMAYCDGTTRKYSISPNIYPFGTEHHFVFTYNSSVGGILYVDGAVALSSGGTVANSIETATPFYYGEWQTYSRYLTGLSRDLRIYNRDLSLSEVKMIYKSGLNG